MYYNAEQVPNVDSLKSTLFNVLTDYSRSVDLNKFGGRFKYSKLLQLIDNTDVSITSNITKIKIRRNLNAQLNRAAQYELCFGNKFHMNPNGFNIKSTGFTVFGETSICYLTDRPNPNNNSMKGTVVIFKLDPNPENSSQRYKIVNENAGVIDYEKGEVNLTTINITSTVKNNDVIEIQAYPESNDIVGLKDLYLTLDISNSEINMIKDTISSGEQISGVGFKFTSSYSNGELTRE